jgi:hypothetical protein
MKNQKMVEVENGCISKIWDGHFEKSYAHGHQMTALEDLIACNGFDFKEHEEKLEKIIIGLLKRNPNNEEYVKEMMGEAWLRGTKEYYARSAIKTRTEKEKEELILKIRNNEY